MSCAQTGQGALLAAIVLLGACTSSTEGGPASANGVDAAAVADATSAPPDGGAPTPDASVPDTGAVAEGGPCGNQTVDPKVLDGLVKAMGLWRWSTQLSGTSETPLDACDASLHYRVGPEAYGPGTTTSSYAACVLSQGGLVPMSAGRLNPPCADIACSGGKMGLLWNTETTGVVYELDANDKPKGSGAYRLTIRPKVPVGYSLVWSGLSGIGGYVMVGPDLGNQVLLTCH